jgi:hypothetical protein
VSLRFSGAEGRSLLPRGICRRRRPGVRRLLRAYPPGGRGCDTAQSRLGRLGRRGGSMSKGASAERVESMPMRRNRPLVEDRAITLCIPVPAPGCRDISLSVPHGLCSPSFSGLSVKMCRRRASPREGRTGQQSCRSSATCTDTLPSVGCKHHLCCPENRRCR